jgi:cellobiose phosphorylase
MSSSKRDVLITPRIDDLGLSRIANQTGLSISALPNGAVFAIEHTLGGQKIMVNQVLASPVAGGMARLCLRIGGKSPKIAPLAGADARSRFGVGPDRFVWEGEQDGFRHQASLWLHSSSNVWLWRVHVVNLRDGEAPCDAVLVQDLGLGEQGFLMGNEAYASQYLDHYIVRHSRAKHVLMSRQNLSQGALHPWVAHGVLEGAAGFATDYRQLMGPAYRDADQFSLAFGADLPSRRLQYETACAALQTEVARLPSGGEATWTFFGVYRADHPEASSDADVRVVDDADRASRDWAPSALALSSPPRTILQDAPPAVVEALDKEALERLYPRRRLVERTRGRALSFFVPGGSHDRHVVLRDKERIVARRHGALLRSGPEMLPAESLLCATAWMHGVFGAQLTIGNTSFHKLFSVSRDPYNIIRGSGLRILVELEGGWRLLTVPSAFEMGLTQCRWIYRLEGRTIIVSTIVSADDAAMQWRVSVEGRPCRFLVFGHLVLGDQELASAGRVRVDAAAKEFAFRPDSNGLWGQRYPGAAYRLTTSTPHSIEAIGGDELLYADGKRRSGGYAAIRTYPTSEFVFAVVGSLTDAREAEALAAKYANSVDDADLLARGDRCWRSITRGIRVKNATGDARAVDAVIPWFVHDAMMHLTVPHGLEQYTGAAWGTRDVCQGPLELLLALEHDEPARSILRTLFAQQYASGGDWPQWFMLEPYSQIQDKSAHGDVIVWPLKALCDYVEATGDFAFLDEKIAWRRDDTLEKTASSDPVTAHVGKLVETVRQRFIPGTRLIRYGNGDWNDSLQPVDPSKHDWMVSSWTVALLYQQLMRYAEILALAKRSEDAQDHAVLAAAMRDDFHRFLLRDGVVAGYAVFSPHGGEPQLLIHPSDKATGLSFSLIPMTQAILAELFTPEETRRHLAVIREHLLFPDGARLMDRPLAYHGGVETFFRRAESASFFGREIGLMYVHSHLRYGEAMSASGDPVKLWEALLVANPIAVADRLANASPRQRNAYFSSSDAAFADRYAASADWDLVKTGKVALDGGWRIYSSGPGLYVSLLMQHALGIKRRFGKRTVEPGLPPSQARLRLSWPERRGRDSGRRRARPS